MIVRAYFFAAADAAKAKAALLTWLKVQGPYVADRPQNRRQLYLEVEVPTGLTRQVEPNLWSRLVGTVQRYDGWVYDEQEARR